MKIKKGTIIVTTLLLVVISFICLHKSNYSDLKIIRYSKRYAVELSNQSNDKDEILIVTGDCIPDNAFKLKRLFHIGNYNFVSVVWHIPSQGDTLNMIIFYNDRTEHFKLISKNIKYAKRIRLSADKKILKNIQTLPPDYKGIPRGYEKAK